MAHGKHGGTGRAQQRRERGVLMALIAVGAAIVMGVAGLAATAGSGPTGAIDAEAFDLPALDGEGRVRLADFRGTPVVVNFFASWCTACDFELPAFAAVSERVRDQVVFVGVNSQETGDGLGMAQRHGITWWPLAADARGSQGSLHAELGGVGMPITAFYDAEGKLIEVAGGALDELRLRALLQERYGVET